MKDMIKFDMPKNQSSIIKVIGVGGGGSNAVNHMFQQGIKGVDFIICNTDAQAMETSPVPSKVQLGDKGLGAGSVPAIGKEAAQQKIGEIRDILEKNTKMLFITAGMGGGTGTGAAPVIAALARELEILTVGIVTLPFSFEGKKRRLQAEEGLKELKQYVDTLLVISNDKIRELYGDLKLSEAFHKADDVLTTAAKGIAEIITVTGYINVDFEDVKTVMKDSGKAIMGSAQAEGENRSLEAVKAALSSPLLNDNDIEGASNVLLYITSGSEEISMDEVTEITDYIQREARSQAEIIWGNGNDDSLGNKISITLIATGFDSERKQVESEENKIRHNLGDEVPEEKPVIPGIAPESMVNSDRIELITKKPLERVLTEETSEMQPQEDPEKMIRVRKAPAEIINRNDRSYKEPKIEERTFIFDLSAPEIKNENTEPPFSKNEVPSGLISPRFSASEKSPVNQDRKPFEVFIKKPAEETGTAPDIESDPITDSKSRERIERLKNLSLKLKTTSGLEELENQPAYVRRNVEITASVPSEESTISRYSLYEDQENHAELRSGNSFLHDNVD
jgi:cell division protein FtsZ